MLRPMHLQDPVLDELSALASRASVIRGAIAYWTIDSTLLGPAFARGLAHANGFLCLDIHHPTSIDHLVALRRTGANVLLHLYDLVGHTEDIGVKGVPPHLMHAKMLLFDLDPTRAALWVGSHNATRRALYGLNLEASLVFELDRSSTNYLRAATMLEAIRQRCDLMDPTLSDYYKWLQSGAKTENVIELEDADDTPIPRSTITVFGTEAADHRQLDKVGKAVFVSITSSATGRERFYPARISQTGEMPKASKAAMGTTFAPRRHAFRRGSRLPLLLPVAPVAAEVYRDARYYATLELKDQLPDDLVAYEPPETPPWVEVDGSELFSSLPERDFSGKRGDRAPRLRRATPPETMHFAPLALEARKQITDHKLVRRRVFVFPGEGD